MLIETIYVLKLHIGMEMLLINMRRVTFVVNLFIISLIYLLIWQNRLKAIIGIVVLYSLFSIFINSKYTKEEKYKPYILLLIIPIILINIYLSNKLVLYLILSYIISLLLIVFDYIKKNF